jgi:hypothetical protein
MRFEFSDEMKQALFSGAGLSFGSDHENYFREVEVGPATRETLVQDLD